MRFITILAALSVLSGCATVSVLPNNQAHIDCSLTGDLTDCYNKANQTCPRGYKVIDKNNETHTGVLSTTHTTNITIQC